MTQYWKQYWETNEITGRDDLQMQVGRTVNRKPIDEERWNKTVQDIISLMKPENDETIMDLCCGNGLLSVPLAEKSQEVIAVDISQKLLDKIDLEKHPNIKTIKSDVLALNFTDGSLDKAVIYFAIQHFDLEETLLLFRQIRRFLKDGGIFYIGDIPEQEKIWAFFNTPEYEKAYFNSIEEKKLIVGQWFSRSFIEKAAIYTGFSEVTTFDQPNHQVNSHYRFDAILKK